MFIFDYIIFLVGLKESILVYLGREIFLGFELKVYFYVRNIR